jgi:LacI family transcriptional regulator
MEEVGSALPHREAPLATIRDVAQAAGVSIATVSRVLNGSPRVSDDARDRVWSAVAELDYWPNTAAQSLTTRRSNAIGVLLPDLYGEFFSEVIRGIDHAARQVKQQVLISSSHADTNTVLSAARAMRGRIDGLIMMAPDQGSIEPIHQIARRFPVLLLNPRSAVAGCSTVSISNFEGARTVVGHLLSLGHTRIAIVNGPKGNVDAEERRRGYRDAFARADLPASATLELCGDFTESSGFDSAQDLLRLWPRPTAVFATNDAMALGLLSALQTEHVRVPEDLAIVGFDDIAIARYASPPLTTIHVDAFELGERSVQLLLQAMSSETGRACHDEVLPAPLVIRRSCGATPAAMQAQTS